MFSFRCKWWNCPVKAFACVVLCNTPGKLLSVTCLPSVVVSIPFRSACTRNVAISWPSRRRNALHMKHDSFFYNMVTLPAPAPHQGKLYFYLWEAKFLLTLYLCFPRIPTFLAFSPSWLYFLFIFYYYLYKYQAAELIAPPPHPRTGKHILR